MALKPLKPGAWDEQHARHLLNRAGFGIPHERVAVLTALGLEGAVETLVDYTPEPWPQPDWVIDPIIQPGQIRRSMEGASDTEIRKAVTKQNRAERLTVQRLKGWWLERMLTTRSPLEEKMTLFWHGHFATSAQKTRHSLVNYHINDVQRTHATGNFKELTIAIGQSPAMLDYLDNRKSSKESPNENWARELMELFTLGVGNYTEDDIKNGARAFTGWTTNYKGWRYDTRRHDFGEKTFMGRTGAFDGWDIIDIIFEQPAAATFICRKLWTYFAYDAPEDAVVEALAETLRANNYELKPVLKQMFQSKAFYSDRAVATQVKSPAQFAVQLCDDLEVTSPPYLIMAQGMKSIGQDLFHPPNVKGWDGGRAWINANSLLLRYNMPGRLTEAAAMAEWQREQLLEMDSEAMLSNGEMKMSMDMDMDLSEEDAVEMMMVTGVRNKAVSKALQEDRKAEYKRIFQQLQARYAPLKRQERRDRLKAFRESEGDARMEILRREGIDPPAWLPEGHTRVFNGIEFANAGECIDALCERLLVTPVTAEQKAAILKALGAPGPDQAMTPDDITFAKRRALIHLITSMAEYQLC